MRTNRKTGPLKLLPERGRSRHSVAMAGISYAKWDALSVSNSEEEPDGDDRLESRAGLAEEHRKLAELVESQQKLRALIDEHKSGKPLQPPEEVRDILEAPLWCDEPDAYREWEAKHLAKTRGRVALQTTTPAGASGQPRAGEGAHAGEGGVAPPAPSSAGAAGTGKSAATTAVAHRAKRRDFAEWDKLKLDDDADDEEGNQDKVGSSDTQPAEAEKLRQLMQLQDGLQKMRKAREERHRQIHLREQRIADREKREANEID